MSFARSLFRFSKSCGQAVVVCSTSSKTVIRKPIQNFAPNNISRSILQSSCRCFHTEGDGDLANFLKEEIAYEEENVTDGPELHNFTVDIQGPKVNLSRNFNGERVDVVFNINENENVDEGLNIEESEYSQDQDDVSLPEIVSYPSFQVKITKPSGKTLHFNALYNKLSEEEGQNDPEEQFDLIRFDSLKIYDQSMKMEDAYEAETENMDGELYSMLMTTLLERGITGAFVNDLLDFSTASEHKQYVKFLKELQIFAKEK